MSKNRSFILPICALFTINAATITPAYASNDITQGGLLGLAHSFVEKIAPSYEDQTTRKTSLSDKTSIPDGSTLLLRPRVGKIIYPYDIYTIKEGNDLYMSLADIIDVLDLAIAFDTISMQGAGWFLREDWRIDLDLKNKKVTSRGQIYNVKEEDTLERDGILFVSGNALSTWLDMDFNYDVAQQYVEVHSDYPLPIVAKNFRENRNKGLGTGNNTPVLPRLKQEKEWLDTNVADVSVGARYNKTSGGEGELENYTNIALQGEFLKHDRYLFVSRDSTDGLQNISARMSKRSEDADLLGPLKARSYAFGEIDSTDIPLTGDLGQSLGFRFDNNPLENSDFSTTDIEGDSIPGWDIELYRDGVLIDSQTVAEDGRYAFNDVALFAGDNDFEVFFYGPQGEIRKEELYVPVTAALLSTQDDTYEVSLAFEEEHIYRDNQAPDPDRGDPHFAARYNKVIGDSLGYVGLRTRSIEGDQRAFFSTGLTSVIGGTLFDTNFAVDDKANPAASITARRTINDWNVALNAQANDEYFRPSESTDPTTLNLSFSALKSYTPKFFDKRGNIIATSAYRETASGTTLTRNSVGLSQQIGRINVSNTLAYESRDGGATGGEDFFDNILAVRGNIGKTFLRGGIDYDFKPDAEIDRIFAQINHRKSAKLSTDLTLDHEPDRDYSRGRLNVNYTHDKFRTSPFFEIDSDDRVYAGVNLNFSLIDPPDSSTPIMTSKRIIGRGLVSGFIFHDKNGNNIYDTGDIPLPEVMLESINSRRRAISKANGYALIDDLPTSRPTDIVVDEASLPDSFMISANPGNSVFPVEGEIIEMQFPVHISGELDGTIYYKNGSGDTVPVRQGVAQIISLDNPERAPLTAKAAFDGFYVASKIPPGRYMVLPKKPRTFGRDIGNTTPEFIEIGYDGTILYDTAIVMQENEKYVPYDVHFEGNKKSTTSPYSTNYTYVLDVKEGGNSELSNVLGSFMKKLFGRQKFEGLTLVKTAEQNDGYARYLSPSNDLEQLHERCKGLQESFMECKITVFVPQNNNIALKE